MRILVTGGAGFIGHNVVKMLQDEHEVDIYDSRTDYGILDKRQLKHLYAERLNGFDGQKFTGDICDKKFLSGVIETGSYNTVIHLASFPRGKVVNSNPVLGAEVMSTALMSLLTLCKAHGVKRFVYISSSMVYGDFDHGVTEDTPCNPRGTYAILKYAGELLVKDYCKDNGMEYVIVRPSAVYGPRDVEDRVISKFLCNAMRNENIVVKGKNEVLDFTYIDDIAKGICLATILPQAKNQTYNMTCGLGCYGLADAAMLAIVVSKSLSYIITERRDINFPKRGLLCIDKAKNELGYAPMVKFDEGMKLYHTWLAINKDYWVKQ
jgi:nucleoside-diphosphate-sugar epimerase